MIVLIELHLCQKVLKTAFFLTLYANHLQVVQQLLYDILCIEVCENWVGNISPAILLIIEKFIFQNLKVAKCVLKNLKIYRENPIKSLSLTAIPIRRIKKKKDSIRFLTNFLKFSNSFVRNPYRFFLNFIFHFQNWNSLWWEKLRSGRIVHSIKYLYIT